MLHYKYLIIGGGMTLVASFPEDGYDGHVGGAPCGARILRTCGTI